MESSDFSDVFISYRRKNVEFAKQLVNALEAESKEVWIDWDDIPPGSESFADDIKRGLEGASAFICILSPDYLLSSYCVDLELGYALELKKKIIPIVLEKFDDKEPINGIRHINWIYFTPHAGHKNTFDESFPKVVTALEADFEHAREHKWIGLRALEWHKNERNPSYLLRGDDLSGAEQWISRAADKDPTPTELHSDYVLVSRETYMRRQRQLIASITIGLVVTLVLAAVALLLYREAEAQRQLADRRAEEWSSLAFANAAQNAIKDALPDRALALALEANSITDPPQTSRFTLADVLNRPGTRARFTHHDDLVRAVDVHPGGAWAASAGNDARVVVWEVAGGDIIAELDAHSDWTTAVAFTADGERLFTASADGTVIPWDTATWEPAGDPINTESLGVDDITLADDRLLTAACTARNETTSLCEASTLQLWDTADGALVREFDAAHTAEIYAVALNPAGDRALTGSGDETMILWDVAAGEPLATFDDHDDDIRDVAFLPDETAGIAASADKRLYRWDFAGETLAQTYVGQGGRVLGVAVSDDGARLAAANEDSSVFVWDLQTGAVLETYREHTAEVHDVHFTVPGRDSLLSTSQDSTVRLWDLESSFNQRTLRGLPGRIVLSLGITSDESLIVAADIRGHLAAWDTADGAQTLRYEHQIGSETQPITSLAMATDDETFFVALSTGEIIELETETGDELRRWTGHDGAFIRAVRVLPGGERMVTCAHDFQMWLWDIETAEVIRTFEGHENHIINCQLNAEGTHALTASSDFRVGYWDLESGELIHMLAAHSDFVWDASFNAAGDRALSGSRDQTMILWDLASGEMIEQYAGAHSSAITGVRFAPQTPYAISGSRDQTLVMWNLETGAVVQVLRGHNEAVWEIEFSADGERMFTTASDMTVREWALAYTLPEFRQWADDARVVRELTDAEQSAFALDTTETE